MDSRGSVAAGTSARDRQMRIAIAGGGADAASVLRLFDEVEGVTVCGVWDPDPSAPALRLAADIGIPVASDLSDLYRRAQPDLVLDVTGDPALGYDLESQRPPGVALVTGSGAELIWDLLAARKRDEEQERVVSELQVAYDRMRSHERRLQSSKEALERENNRLEERLAEIFFTHEFFKTLAAYTSVSDVTSLVVDGANGILGAEISAVYLVDHDAQVLRLCASQGMPEDTFRPIVPWNETILGAALREGCCEDIDVERGSALAEWSEEAGSIRSQAARTLRIGDTIFGVLLVASSTRRALSRAELDRFGVIANQSSLALQNALLHEELERLSVTDRLTELYNHGYLHQRLEQELERAARFGHTFSLIMLDIDDFKQFNDRFGHPSGDTVLRAVSAIIRQNLREIDVAARYGGEEFVIVLPETDTEGAVAVAERVRRSMAEYSHVPAEGLEPVVETVSLGVATYPGHARTSAGMIEAADRAMYEAKRLGKNQVAVAG